MIQLSPPPFSTDALPKFEALVAKATGTKHALATSSGTAAIHLALMALGIKRGDVVLCPTFTFVATANPILYCGADPVFIGCNKQMGMDFHAVCGAIACFAPKAVIVASLYGGCHDYRLIRSVCDFHHIPVIEDACEALGASAYRGRRAGSIGDMAAVSFNLNKIVTTGGGGALVSDRADLIERARFLASQSKDPAPYYLHSSVGYNYRMPSPAADVGVRQMRKLRSLVAERRGINRQYRKHLPSWFFVVPGGRSTHWLTVGRCRDPQAAITALAAHCIEARRMWNPLHRQPLFAAIPYVGDGVADKLFETGICLPSKGLAPDQVEFISNIVREYL